MKLPKTGILLVLLSCGFCATAQDVPTPVNLALNKAKIFSDLPDRMPLQVADMESLLDLPIGTKVSASMTRNFTVVGNVVSRSNGADAGVKSVVIKTINRLGSTFTVTRITAKDGTSSYIGRMVNRSGGDALEIVKEGQEYSIRKKGLNDLLNE